MSLEKESFCADGGRGLGCPWRVLSLSRMRLCSPLNLASYPFSLSKQSLRVSRQRACLVQASLCSSFMMVRWERPLSAPGVQQGFLWSAKEKMSGQGLSGITMLSDCGTISIYVPMPDVAILWLHFPQQSSVPSLVALTRTRCSSLSYSTYMGCVRSRSLVRVVRWRVRAQLAHWTTISWSC